MVSRVSASRPTEKEKKEKKISLVIEVAFPLTPTLSLWGEGMVRGEALSVFKETVVLFQ